MAVAVAGVVVYLVTLIAWFALGPGSVLARLAGVALPLVGAVIVVTILFMLPNSMCGEGMWMPCLYRAFQFAVAFSFLWPLGAWARIILHRAGPQEA